MIEKQIIEKTKDWLWELTEPNEKFGGFGICPFLKKELTNDDMKFVIMKSIDGKTFKNGLDNWIKENKYNSVLFICLKFRLILKLIGQLLQKMPLQITLQKQHYHLINICK